MQLISLVFFAFLMVLMLIIKLEGKVIKQTNSLILLQKITLLTASYIFIGYANIWFAVILFAQSCITWYCAKKGFYRTGIVCMILCLAAFKYTNFFYASLMKLFGSGEYILLKIILPLGISFYTFSAISYILDVKRSKTDVHSLLDAALYLSFFPKFVSGPIQRSGDFFQQINQPRTVSGASVSQGLQIFLFGVFKKMVLADHLAVFVNQVYASPAAFSSGTIFLGIISYSLQIYFDFSGYSDMAIGTARLFDIRLPDNFNLPYLAHNVTELWKRWHITLSSWLQDYLYIPLGGSRKGKVRTYMNLILIMVIGGLWHGANWTFIIWGLLHGIGLAVHKIWMDCTGSSQKSHSLMGNLCSIAVTFTYTSLCWVFFRAETAEKALDILQQLFGFHKGIWHPFIWTFISIAILMIAGILAANQSKHSKGNLTKPNQSYVRGYYPVADLNTFWGIVSFFVFGGLIIILAYTGGSPFIYGAY